MTTQAPGGHLGKIKIRFLNTRHSKLDICVSGQRPLHSWTTRIGTSKKLQGKSSQPRRSRTWLRTRPVSQKTDFSLKKKSKIFSEIPRHGRFARPNNFRLPKNHLTLCNRWQSNDYKIETIVTCTNQLWCHKINLFKNKSSASKVFKLRSQRGECGLHERRIRTMAAAHSSITSLSSSSSMMTSPQVGLERRLRDLQEKSNQVNLSNFFSSTGIIISVIIIL